MIDHGLFLTGVIPVLKGLATPSVAGPLDLAAGWGGSLMFTTGIIWVALAAGIALAVLSLGARTWRVLRRLRDAALIQIAASLAIGLMELATPEGATLAPIGDLTMMTLAAAVLGILALFLVTSRRRRQMPLLGEAPDAQAHFLDSIATAIGREQSLDRMVMAVASSLRAATGSRAALAFKIDPSDHRPMFVGSAVPPGSHQASVEPSELALTLAGEYAISGCVSEHRPDSETNRRRTAPTWVIVPLSSGQNVLATILLQSPAVPMSASKITATITTAAELAGRALSDWVGAVRGIASDRLAHNLHRLSAELLDEQSLERGLPIILHALNGIVPVDYLSLSWLNRAHFHEDRASMIVGQRRVVENRRKWPIWDGTTRRLLGTARPLITPDLHQAPEETPVGGAWESRLGLRSRIVVPIRDRQRLLGSVTLAHRTVACYGLAESGPLIAIASTIGLWLKHLGAARAGRRYNDVTRLSARWDADPFRLKTDQELLAEAHNAIKTSALRLYRLTPDGQAMEIVARSGRPDERSQQATRIPLIRTPWHRWSLEDGGARRIDQSDPESLMEPAEAELSMIPRMKTGWIVPITSGNRTVGFVDAMETRDPDRRSLEEPERLLLGSLARAFARRWMRTSDRDGFGAETQTWHERLTEFNHRIINPLTGIIGSVELIRHKQPVLTDESIKYLNIIERSAGKIHGSALQSLCSDEGSGQEPEEHDRLRRRPEMPSADAERSTDMNIDRIRQRRFEQPTGVTMAL